MITISVIELCIFIKLQLLTLIFCIVKKNKAWGLVHREPYWDSFSQGEGGYPLVFRTDGVFVICEYNTNFKGISIMGILC